MSDAQPHDSLFKAVFARAAAAKALFSAFLPGELAQALDLGSLQLDAGNPVSDRLDQRFADLLFRVSARGQPVLLHLLLEHKSSPDPLTVLDLFARCAVLLSDQARRHGSAKVPMVIPIVIYHGVGAFRAPTALRDVFFGDEAFRARLDPWIPTFPVVVVDLGTHHDVELRRVRDQDPVAACGLWLLKWSRHPAFEERFFQDVSWFSDAVESAHGGHAAELLLRYTLLFIAPHTSPLEFAERLSKTVGRKAAAMARNILESCFEQGERQGREVGREEGHDKGRKEGREEGREEATVATLRRATLLVLKRRFSGTEASLTEALASIGDAPALEDLLAAASEARSLAEFETVMRATIARSQPGG